MPLESADYFNGKVFVLELGEEILEHLPWPERLPIIKRIQEHGGRIASIVDERTSFVVSRKVTEEEFEDCLPLQYAVRLGVPIVSLKYLDGCEQNGECLDVSEYKISMPQEAVKRMWQNLAVGTEVIPQSTTDVKPCDSSFAAMGGSTARRTHFFENYSEEQASSEWPPFPLDSYIIVRQHFFRHQNEARKLELHIAEPTAFKLPIRFFKQSVLLESQPLCPQSHPMVTLNGKPPYYPGWQCDLCNASIPHGTSGVLHCKACEHDVCPKCQRKPRCKQGHFLAEWRSTTWSCDVCGSGANGRRSMACRLCDFDICPECISKETCESQKLPGTAAAFFDNSVEAEDAYRHLYKKFLSAGFEECQMVSSVVGSRIALRRALVHHPMNTAKIVLPKETENFVRNLYKDAWEQLVAATKISISTVGLSPFGAINLVELAKAEAALIHINRTLVKSMKDDVPLSSADMEQLRKHSKAFFSIIPASAGLASAIDTKGQGDQIVSSPEVLELLEDITRMLRSMLSIGECSGGNVYAAPPLVQYGALSCEIEWLPANSAAFKFIAQKLLESACGKETVNIANVWQVRKESEHQLFERSLENQQLLYHASRAGNWASILGRGLRIPLAARLRRDRGMLGRGIYFGDSLTTALRYTTASSQGTAFVLVCCVGLGRMFHTRSHRYDFEAAPEGYDSVHGVRATDASSDFLDDEYVIYRETQQRMAYLVEFIQPSKPVAPPSGFLALKCDSPVAMPSDTSNFSSAFGVNGEAVDELLTDPKVKSQAVGLLASGDVQVPLRNTRIKAKIIDLIAEVHILQQYYNGEAKPVEAKYVFPLSSGCAVCAFEAYINDKKVVGKVKEKEQARKEYKAAVEAGHGAYLMDESEETPDVFTVSVGNLPPKCDVVIRITYILELQVSAARNAVEFIIPSSIHPAVRDTEMKTITQSTTGTIGSYSASDGCVGIEVGLDMPFDITSVECSHELTRKRTAQRATFKCGNLDMTKDFVLLVRLSVMSTPRIWVETDEQRHSKAAMITFFPEIESAAQQKGARHEIIVMIDSSASMGESSAMEDAKIATMMLLRMLSPSWLFNIVTFGSYIYHLFPKARPSSAENIEAAVDFVQKVVGPNMGGTDARSAIEALAALYKCAPARTVDAVMFTDGFVEDESSTYKALQQAGGMRMFTVGVGTAASGSVLRSIATQGRGQSEILPHATKSKWRYAITKQVQRSSQPALTHIDVEWSTEQSARLRHQINATVLQSPKHVTSLFNGESAIIYGMVKHQARQCELVARRCGADVSRDQYGYWPEQRFLVTVHGLSFRTGNLIHKLAARSRIRDFTDGVLVADSFERNEAVKVQTKQAIINLGCEFGLVTPFTSMIAVEERTEEEKKAQAKADKKCTTPSIDVLAAEDFVDPIPEVMYEEAAECDWITSLSAGPPREALEEEIVSESSDVSTAESTEEEWEDEEVESTSVSSRSHEETESSRSAASGSSYESESDLGLEEDESEDEDEEEEMGFGLFDGIPAKVEVKHKMSKKDEVDFGAEDVPRRRRRDEPEDEDGEEEMGFGLFDEGGGFPAEVEVKDKYSFEAEDDDEAGAMELDLFGVCDERAPISRKAGPQPMLFGAAGFVRPSAKIPEPTAAGFPPGAPPCPRPRPPPPLAPPPPPPMSWSAVAPSKPPPKPMSAVAPSQPPPMPMSATSVLAPPPPPPPASRPIQFSSPGMPLFAKQDKDKREPQRRARAEMRQASQPQAQRQALMFSSPAMTKRDELDLRRQAEEEAIQKHEEEALRMREVEMHRMQGALRMEKEQRGQQEMLTREAARGVLNQRAEEHSRQEKGAKVQLREKKKVAEAGLESSSSLRVRQAQALPSDASMLKFDTEPEPEVARDRVSGCAGGGYMPMPQSQAHGESSAPHPSYAPPAPPPPSMTSAPAHFSSPHLFGKEVALAPSSASVTSSFFTAQPTSGFEAQNQPFSLGVGGSAPRSSSSSTLRQPQRKPASVIDSLSHIEEALQEAQQIGEASAQALTHQNEQLQAIKSSKRVLFGKRCKLARPAAEPANWLEPELPDPRDAAEKDHLDKLDSRLRALHQAAAQKAEELPPPAKTPFSVEFSNLAPHTTEGTLLALFDGVISTHLSVVLSTMQCSGRAWVTFSSAFAMSVALLKQQIFMPEWHATPADPSKVMKLQDVINEWLAPLQQESMELEAKLGLRTGVLQDAAVQMHLASDALVSMTVSAIKLMAVERPENSAVTELLVQYSANYHTDGKVYPFGVRSTPSYIHCVAPQSSGARNYYDA